MPDVSDAEIAIAAAIAGAEQVRRQYGGPFDRHAKEGTDFATSADLASEDAIRAVLAEHRPHDAMVGEEAGHTGPDDAERAWLVDPLCGTRNFAAQTPLVAVNVAVTSGGRTLAAASADPFSREVFWTDGDAAYLRAPGIGDSPLQPSSVSRLVEVDLEHPGLGNGLRLLAHPDLRRDYSPRAGGTTLALAWLAAGRRAGYVEEGDLRGSVHFAAPIAIAQAAGCVVTGVRGQPLDTEPFGLLAAADEETHAKLLRVIAWP